MRQKPKTKTKAKVDKTVSKAEFDRYLRIQHGGRYNMFSSEARIATDLSSEKYTYIISNYEKLMDLYGPYGE